MSTGKNKNIQKTRKSNVSKKQKEIAGGVGKVKRGREKIKAQNKRKSNARG